MPYMIVLIIAIVSGGYLYVDNLQREVADLRNINAAYELRDKEQKEVIEQLEKDHKMQTQAISDLTVQNQKNQEEMNRYLSIFKRHNLSKLAAAKPGLIETRANRGTKEVFDAIENDSRTIDDLDDGVQLVPEAASGSQGSN